MKPKVLFMFCSYAQLQILHCCDNLSENNECLPMDYLLHRTTTDWANNNMANDATSRNNVRVASQDESSSSDRNSHPTETDSRSTTNFGKAKSQVVSFDTSLALSLQTDLPVEQVEDNHYVFRRGSTEVHVETYAASQASDVIGEEKGKASIRNAIRLLSVLEAMAIFMITLVIKLTVVVVSSFNRLVEFEYMLALNVICFVTLTYYNFKGTFRKHSQVIFSKSHKSSNRWLKGVVVLFGLAVVLKDGLEFLSQLLIDSEECNEKNQLIAFSFFNAMFILSQVKYLFRFSKVYIRNCSAGSRMGLMLIIAANLSSWISLVIDETVHALHDSSSQDQTTTSTTSSPIHNKSLTEDSHANTADQNCTCTNSFCNAVTVATTFLFPFLIEFSLVASCLLIVTWSNIGKNPPPCQGVIKPSYKFYKSYAGLTVGSMAMFVTIIIIIILGTTEVQSTSASYFTETSQLIVYNSFLVGLQICMLIACCIGFYLFVKIERPNEKSSMLDNVLLLICILGPLAINTFSLLAVISGQDNKIYGWELSIVAPLCDIFQSVLQLIFILFGLQREPITSNHAKETAADLRRGIASQLKKDRVIIDSGSGSCEPGGVKNKTFLRSRRNSITSVVSALANENSTTVLQSPPLSPALKRDPTSAEILNTKSDVPQIVITSNDDQPGPDEEENCQSEQDSNEDGRVEPMQATLETTTEQPLSKQSILKIVTETRLARPDKLRLHLRDVIMFLLIANACLWVFMSLDGTAFTVYFYESIFFGTSTWTTIMMICRPLNIFFRMHSAGCLFEMWSFA